jgi:exonuclease VII small subunit
MKTENILANIKSKSLKEATDEINEILSKLENKEVDLNSSIEDYKRLIQLNKYIEDQFKKKSKAISLIKNSNNNDKK